MPPLVVHYNGQMSQPVPVPGRAAAGGGLQGMHGSGAGALEDDGNDASMCVNHNVWIASPCDYPSVQTCVRVCVCACVHARQL